MKRISAALKITYPIVSLFFLFSACKKSSDPVSVAGTWTELGNENNALNANGFIYCLATDASGNLFAAGDFKNSSGKKYVVKWNGSSWAEQGTGTNVLNPNPGFNDLITDASGNLYAAVDFQNGLSRHYVAKWNGSTWAELGTGSNALNANELISAITMDPSGNIYASGFFRNSSLKNYVAKWNGSTWIELGTGSNALNADFLNSIYALTSDAAGNIYAAGDFTNSNNKSFVAKWNGSTWTELGTGSNALNANTQILTLTTDLSGNVYAAGSFTNGASYQYGRRYVAKWNGSTWKELGTGSTALNADHDITHILVDPSGNVYAGGLFTNGNVPNSGRQYVAKWNGSAWTELGAGTNVFNSYISILARDASGNIYAAGRFKNSSGKYFIAKYNN